MSSILPVAHLAGSVYDRDMAKMIGKTHRVGWGGRTCVCCYPAPKDHTKMNRAAKRAERQNWKKESFA